MRDIFFVAFLFYAIYYTFKKPYLGVAAWIWIALVGPTEWAFGFSQEFRLNLTIVLITVLSFAFYKNKYSWRFTSIHFWVFLFLFWMFISTIFNIRMDEDYAWDKMLEFTKVIAIFLFIILTVRKEHEVDTLIWAIVLSVSAYAGMEAIKFLISGGGHRIVGKVGILADRNDLAVAINMCIPLIIYLWSQTKHVMLRNGLLVLIALNCLAIIGTYSRGGFIGLLILAFAFWLKSKKKLVIVLITLMIVPVGVNYLPSEWRERQDTVETAATTDNSFIGRLWAWKIATLIAIDNPITGGGFKATTDPILWMTYAPYTDDFGPIETPPIPPNHFALAAHNIYFQVLASAGFVGLFIFVMMLWSGFRKCWRLSTSKSALESDWKKKLAKAISLALIGYGITGLNVSLAYFELVYALLAIIVIITAIEPSKENPNASYS